VVAVCVRVEGSNTSYRIISSQEIYKALGAAPCGLYSQAKAVNSSIPTVKLNILISTLSEIQPIANITNPFSPTNMSNNAGSNVPNGSDCKHNLQDLQTLDIVLITAIVQVDASKYGSYKTADPETVSITTVSSSAPLVKQDEQKQKNGTEIDAKKLQEQALKSQIRFCM
jgi:hypothetical protein